MKYSINNTSVRLRQKESVLLRFLSESFFVLKDEVKDLEKVFINSIELSPDGSSLKLFLYSHEGEAFIKQVINQLKFYRPSLKKSIANNLELRIVPEILFCFDKGFEKQSRLEHLIDKTIGDDKEKEEAKKNIKKD